MSQTVAQITGIFKAGVVGGEENAVGIFAAGFTDTLQALGRTVAGNALHHGDIGAGIVVHNALEGGLAANAVVHIVDEHRNAAALVHIGAARHLQLGQGPGNHRRIALHPAADGNGDQSVGDVEQAVHGHTVRIGGAGVALGDGEGVAAGGTALDVAGDIVAVVLLDAHQQHALGFCLGGCVNGVKIGGVAADNGRLAVFQQRDLAGKIVLHGGMLPLADMVGADVQKYAEIKVLAVDAADLIGLTGDLRGGNAQSVVADQGQHTLEIQGFRRGQVGQLCITAHIVLHTAEQPRAAAGHGIHHLMGHAGGGGLALGAGDTDEGQGSGGMIVEPLRRQALGLAHIGNRQAGESRAFDGLGRHVANGTALGGHLQIFRLEAVALADEQIAGLDLTGVVGNAGKGYGGNGGIVEKIVPAQLLRQGLCIFHVRFLLILGMGCQQWGITAHMVSGSVPLLMMPWLWPLGQ